MNPRREQNGEVSLPIAEVRDRVRQNGVSKLVAVVDAEFSEEHETVRPLTAEARLDAQLNAFFGRGATQTTVDGAPMVSANDVPIRRSDLELAA